MLASWWSERSQIKTICPVSSFDLVFVARLAVLKAEGEKDVWEKKPDEQFLVRPQGSYFG